MIKSWRHKGLEEFFFSGSKAGIRPDHASRLRRQLAQLNIAQSAQDMNLPGWKLHGLDGSLAGHYSVSVRKLANDVQVRRRRRRPRGLPGLSLRLSQ